MTRNYKYEIYENLEVDLEELEMKIKVYNKAIGLSTSSLTSKNELAAKLLEEKNKLQIKHWLLLLMN